MQTVTRFVESQSVPFSSRIVGVSRCALAGTGAPCRSGPDARQHCVSGRRRMHDEGDGRGARDGQPEQSEGIVRPQPQRTDQEDTTSSGREADGRRPASTGAHGVPTNESAGIHGQQRGTPDRLRGRVAARTYRRARAAPRFLETERGECHVTVVRHLHVELARTAHRDQRGRNHDPNLGGSGPVRALEHHHRSDDNGKSENQYEDEQSRAPGHDFRHGQRHRTRGGDRSPQSGPQGDDGGATARRGRAARRRPTTSSVLAGHAVTRGGCRRGRRRRGARPDGGGHR